MKHIVKRAAAIVFLTTLAYCVAGRNAEAQGTPPASVDKTSPRTQAGLTLLAVTRGDAQGQYTFPVPANMDFLSGPRGNGPAGGIGLWVRGPKPPAPTFQKRSGVFVPPSFFQPPSASARALNNDAIPMQVEPTSSFSNDPRGGQPAPLYLATLPGGYPSGYPAIDVTMFGAQGHAAHWRLIRLAAPFHAIAPSVATHSNFAGAGVKLGVHAWRDTGYIPIQHGAYSYQQQNMGVHYEIAAQVPAGTRWMVRIFKRQLEWEAVRPDEIAVLQASRGPRYANMMRRQPLWITAFGPGTQFPNQDMIQTPYGKYSRFLRLSGEIVQLASTTESVTFHSLNIRQSTDPKQLGGMRNTYTPPPSYEVSTRPQSVTTPSGISMTLLPLSALAPNSNSGGYGMPSSIRMLLRFGQELPGQSPYQQATLILPRSPLYKKYHKPITYALQAPKPYFLDAYGGFSQQSAGAPVEMLANLRLPFHPPVRVVRNGQVTYQPAPSSIPKYLSSLTLNVVQQAELRTIPISFVVPIGNVAPAHTFSGIAGRAVH